MERIELLKNGRIVNKVNKEYYNTLKTNIQFLGKDKRVLCITSVSPDEGKSVVSINLAISLAQANLKVLYIDADIRNSAFAGRFRFNGKSNGLTSYLSGVCTVKDIFYKTDVEGLDVIPAGKFPPNPTTLLQGRDFTELISTCRKYYNYIIIDTSPIGMVIDAAIISKCCDGNIIVTESGKIKRKYIERAISQLEQSGTDFLGIILNKINIDHSEYGKYGSYGSYGSYGNYGEVVDE